MTIIWCMVPAILSTTDRIFCHFGPFLPFYSPNNPKNQNFEKMKKDTSRYYHFTQVYRKWQWYDVWFLRYGAWRTECFVILDRFLHSYSPKQPKKSKFWKMIKMPGDIIILQMCTINDNYMMYGSWDMKHVMDRIFCHFGLSFSLSPP